MADSWQLTLLKSSVAEWNAWRRLHPSVPINLVEADLRGTDLRGANLRGADLRGASLREADLQGANLFGASLFGANLFGADLRGADLRWASLRRADFRGADVQGAELQGANLQGPDLQGAELRTIYLGGAKWGPLPSESSAPESHSGQSSPTTNWLSLVETFGSNLFIAAATLASIIQGLDVVERRWREHKEKQKQHPAQTPQSSSVTPSQSPASLSHKATASDREITEICLVMDDGSHHSLKRWVSDPDTLRAYIDAFNDPMSKVKPLRVVFMKREGRALSVDITAGGKDNRQLDVILGYLDADPHA